MESFYELAFPDVEFDLDGDTMIECPFPHQSDTGKVYYETSASMSINIQKEIYHCFGCGAKGNETDFISKYKGISKSDAKKFKEILNRNKDTIEDWQINVNNLDMNSSLKQKLYDLGLTDKTIKKLNIGIKGVKNNIAYPVSVFGKIVDVVTYRPNEQPKYIKQKGSTNGMIMPYDSWKETNKKTTTIVAGQKDLAIALEKGINAVAITGGEGTIPKFFLNDFKDKNVYIVYDNDEAGRKGANKVAGALLPYVNNVKIVDLSSVCKEKGEDLWDFFMKYKKTKEELIKLYKQAKLFNKEDLDKVKEIEYPTVSLSNAIKKEYLNKTLRSNIQVVAMHERKYLLPVKATVEKIRDDDKKGILNKGDKKTWEFSYKRAKTLFSLIDGNIKEDDVKKSIKKYVGYPKEPYLAVNIDEEETTYKATITDHIETTQDGIDDQAEEFIAYSIGQPLESGKSYKVTYRLVPHPFQGNALYMIISDVQNSQDSVNNFKINEQIVKDISVFQQKENQTVEEKVAESVEKLKGIVQADYDTTLLLLIDLFFHTPLLFNTPKMKNLRGYLDMLIVSESRVGKSTTADALRALYGLGTKISLSGKNASVAGIIGGSHKTANGFQLKAGALPRANKTAVIFEELQKADADLLKELTDIRSSNYASITRVSGSTRLPVFVRMLSLTNTVASGSAPKPISSYPNGIEIITELVGAAEDIARYDMIAVLASKGAASIDPYFEPPEPYSKQSYKEKIRWIWSRKKEQIEINQETYAHAVNTANELNKVYNSYIKIFGTEAWLKIIRAAIAIAGYVVSTDESFEKIVVKKEHIDYAAKLIVSLYDNETFRLKEYVEAENKEKVLNNGDIETLEKIYKEASPLLIHLETYNKSSQRTLQSVAGLDQSSFVQMMSRLTSRTFIKFTNYDVIPTEKLRKGMKKINRDIKNVEVRL